MKKLIIGLITTLAILLPAATAGAHGTLTKNGNTWKTGGYVFGSGTILATSSHATLSITVTLQKYYCAVSCPGWYTAAGPVTKTATNQTQISVQTKEFCSGGVIYPFRVKVSYNLQYPGTTAHTGTYYAGQQSFGCT